MKGPTISHKAPINRGAWWLTRSETLPTRLRLSGLRVEAVLIEQATDHDDHEEDERNGRDSGPDDKELCPWLVEMGEEDLKSVFGRQGMVRSESQNKQRC